MRPKILLIDDDPNIVKKMEDLLAFWKVDYDVVSNPELKPGDDSPGAKEAFIDSVVNLVEHNSDDRLHAVFLDVLFDGIDERKPKALGYEIGQRLRIDFPSLPIILFSIDEGYQNALNSFNFDGYIIKGQMNNWETRIEFDAVLNQAKNRRQQVLDECVAINSRKLTSNAVDAVIMHISDIHRGFDSVNDDSSFYNSTINSLVRDNLANRDPRIAAPNMIIVSGDITSKGSVKGYSIANRFLSDLSSQLEIPRDRIILCPGNHDLDRQISRLSFQLDPYKTESDNDALRTGEPNERYSYRFAEFKSFFDEFYDGSPVFNISSHKMFTVFDFAKSSGIVVVSFNSCEILDHFLSNQERSYIAMETLDNVASEIERRNLKSFPKIAVWHHPVLKQGQDVQRYHARFSQRLEKLGFIFYLHGHMHDPIDSALNERPKVGIQQFGAGTIGTMEVPPDVPRQYQIIVFNMSRKRYTIFSRQRLREDWIPLNSFKIKNKPAKDSLSFRF